MEKLLEEAIKRSGGDDLIFFQSAYIWRFKKQVDMFGDVLAWRVQKAIPQYIKEYLKHVYDL